MDRGTRRIQKARIRARLKKVFAAEMHELRQYAFLWNRPVRPADVEKLRRHICRNEGKRVVLYGHYNPYIEESKYRSNSRRTRTLREDERMEQDARQWRMFGQGAGEEGE